MSPLKIEILLRMYSHRDPFDIYPYEQKHSPAMYEAFETFRRQGVIRPDIVIERDWASDDPNQPRLTAKGLDLVNRLKAVTVEP
jgi:hypothetical protein